MAIIVTTHGPVWTATDVVVILPGAASPATFDSLREVVEGRAEAHLVLTQI